MNLCEKCGSTLTTGPLGGMCPRCLISEGLDDSTLPLDETARISGPVFTRSFGGYELLEEVARGGMGIVYRARQASLGRIVAVKVLSAGEFASPEYVQRFRTEATAAARLQHPNIVAIHEVGNHQGVQFFSMDYVEGPSLTAFVGGKPLAAGKCVAILRALTEGIRFAHQNGILHRDLKPSNVLIDPFGEPRLTDFGLAKEMAGNSDLTITGQVLGTPGYMAPEQADPKFGPLSAASDVYSLGAILYFMLTARPPFVSGSLHETLRQVIETDPVKPRLLNSAAPTDLETICLKCLEKDPARRYATAKELVDELDRFSAGRPIQARPIGKLEVVWRWCRREPAAASLAGAVFLLLVALASGATVAAVRIAAARDAQRSERLRAERTVNQLEAKEAEDLLRGDRASRGLAHLAHVLRKDPTNQVAASRIASVLMQRNFPLPLCAPMKHDAVVWSVSYSSDGALVATGADDGVVRVWDAHDGHPVTPPMRHTASVFYVGFTPDDRLLISAGEDRTVRVWDAKTGKEALPPITQPAPLGSVSLSRSGVLVVGAGTTVRGWRVATGEAVGPVIEQGGKVALVDIARDGRTAIAGGSQPRAMAKLWDLETGKQLAELKLNNTFRLMAVEIDPGGELALTADYGGATTIWEAPTGRKVCEILQAGVVESAVFSPLGGRVATACRDGVARVWDAHTGEPLTPPMRHATVVAEVQFSRDGRRLWTRCWDDTATIWDATTGERYCEPLHLDQTVKAAELSPDGEHMITSVADRTTMLWDIRPGAQHPMFFSAGKNGGCCFSKDGVRLLVSGSDGPARVWSAATAEAVTPVMTHPGFNSRSVWSPDERRILTVGLNSGGVVWDAATGARIAVLAPGGASLDWAEFSPDGRSVVTAGRDATAMVWDAATGERRGQPMRHKDRLWMARYSPDGSRVVTASDDYTARVFNPVTGEAVTPPLQHDAQVYCASFSPDGKRVVTASFDLTARVWDAATGAPIGRPLKHHSGLRWAGFSPDGTRIVTVSGDNTARIWDARQFNAVSEPLQHQGEVWRADFSRDGRLVVTTSVDGTARVWLAENGQPLTEPLHRRGWPTGMSLSPDSRLLALAEDLGGCRVYELPPFGPPPSWLVDLAESVAGERVTDVGFEAVPAARLLDVAARAKTSNGTNEWDGFLHWFLADRGARALSPSARVGTPKLVESLVKDGGFEAGRDALALAPRRCDVLLGLARQAVLEERAGVKTPWAGPDYFRRWLLSSREAHWTRVVVGEASDYDAALEEMRLAGGIQTYDERFHRFMGTIALKAGRADEAVEAFQQAAILLPPGDRAHQGVVAAGLRNALFRAGRRAEALTNALLPLVLPQRAASATPRQVDLSAFYNAGLDEPWHSFVTPGNSLAELPRGLVSFDGVRFDVRGVVQLSSSAMDKFVIGYPPAVERIPVKQRCAGLHFLHAGGWTLGVRAGIEVGRYRIHYAGGGEREAPLIAGEDIEEWQPPQGGNRSPSRASVAWRGRAPAGAECVLYHLLWRNPEPDTEIESLDFVSSGTESAPFLVALTAE